MNRIYPYIGLLIITVLLNSCNISSKKQFHNKRYTKTRTHNKRLILANNKIKNVVLENKNSTSKTSQKTIKEKVILKSVSNSEKQKIELSIFKNKLPIKPKTIIKKRPQQQQISLEKKPTRSSNKEKKFHKGISIINMIIGTITVFFGIGIITFTFGYLSMSCYYQNNNLELSKTLYISGLVLGILSVTVLLFLII